MLCQHPLTGYPITPIYRMALLTAAAALSMATILSH
jgi:hypothetical protein